MILLYRILTYVLLPFACFFSLIAVVTFFVALANPALFIRVFMVAAFCIYFFCTFRFLHTGILEQQPLKTKLRDWIKVNAYVALPFGILEFMQSSTIIGKPELLADAVAQLVEMQQRMGLPAQSTAGFDKLLIAFVYIVLVFALVLLVHIMLTFSLVKKYQHFFAGSESQGAE
jgi:hypothetical protein